MFARSFRFRSQRTSNVKRSKSCRPRIEWMEPRTLLSAVTWTGGGGDNNWDTAANWSTDSVPGSGDDVTINIAANVVHSDNVTDSINSLTSTEPLTISGGTLSIAAASTIDNTLSITGGTLTGTGDLTVSGLVTLTSGTLSGSSALNANGGMLITDNTTGASFEFWTAARSTTRRPDRHVDRRPATNIEISDGSVFNNLGTFLARPPCLLPRRAGAASSFNNTGKLHLDRRIRVHECSVQHARRVSRRTDRSASYSTTAAQAPVRRSTSSPRAPSNSGIRTRSTRPRPSAAAGQMAGLWCELPASLARKLHLHGFHGRRRGDAPGRRLAGRQYRDSDSGDGGALSGTGTVGAITVDSANVSPGDGGEPGILNVQGRSSSGRSTMPEGRLAWSHSTARPRAPATASST